MLVLILFISLSCKEKQKGIEPNYALLALDELANLPQEKILFVDFRNPEAFASGHIPGALNLWRNDIEDRTK